MSTPTRDELRASIFSSKNKLKKSKIINFFGQKIELKQPTLNESIEMAELAGTKKAGAGAIWVLIRQGYIPGTDEKVFEPQDEDNLLNLPIGPWLNEINEAVEELTNITMDEKEKKSAQTT